MAESSKPKDERSFLIGGGSYHNLPTLRCVADEGEFRLDPTPLSFAHLAFMNGLFASFFGAIYWLCYPLAGWETFLVTGVWVFTAVMYTILVCFLHAKSARLGPALIFDKKTGKLRIPRHNESFGKDDDIWLECLTARFSEDSSSDPCSELNLVLMVDGNKQRWNVLRSIATINPFNGMEREIGRETGLRVIRHAG